MTGWRGFDSHASYKDKKNYGITMKKIFNWVLAATLICGAFAFTACSSDDDNKVSNDGTPALVMIAKTSHIDYWSMPAFNFGDPDGFVPAPELLDNETMTYAINIVDHANEPSSVSTIAIVISLCV